MKQRHKTNTRPDDFSLVPLAPNDVGRLAESIIEKKLLMLGYEFQARNVRIGNKGEIDLVFIQNRGEGKRKLICIEVKSDLSLVDLGLIHLGDIESSIAKPLLTISEPLLNVYERVSAAKRRRVINCAQAYAFRYNTANNKDYNDFELEIYLAHVELVLNSRIFKKSLKKVTRTEDVSKYIAKNKPYNEINVSGLFDNVYIHERKGSNTSNNIGFSHLEFFRM